METTYKQCKRCVIDTTSKNIVFDSEGNCNYCTDYLKLANRTIFRSKEVRDASFDRDLKEIKSAGKNKKYDCILGVSGGVDSSYMVLVAKDLGLRPLLVHFDNGWNDESAVRNISSLVKHTGFDLHTYVIDWEGFRDMQLAYFKAGVIDLEVPTDMFIFGALYEVATKFGIKYILSGSNLWTEAILPKDWVYSRKYDFKNMTSIYQKFGMGKLKKIPHLSINRRFWYEIIGYKTIALFDRLDFNEKEVKERLVKDVGYIVYPCKHFESVFTRFYQGYYLRKKYGIDKRKAHLSNLIMTNQMSRADALAALEEEPYPMRDQMEDKDYVEKKWGLTPEQFEEIMLQPKVEHKFYGEEDVKPSWYLDLLHYFKMVYLYKFAYPLGIRQKPLN